MKNDILKIGVLGTASIAQRYIIPNILELKDKFQLVGIASRDKSRGEEFAKQFGCASFSSYDSLINQPDINAVYIPLPNALHFAWINKSLDRGLHVLVEKSLTCSKNETFELSRKADDKGLILMENFQFRFHSQLKWILEQVELGMIGELRCVRSSFGFPPFKDPNNIRYQKDLGGGALLDVGAYPIKISQIILGSNIKVECASMHYDHQKNVDIWGAGTLVDEETGVHSQIAFGFDQSYQCSVELWGSKGRIFTNRIFTSPPGLEPIMDVDFDGKKETITLDADNHFKNMLNHFYGLCDRNISESKDNISQSSLIEEFRRKAHEKDTGN